MLETFVIIHNLTLAHISMPSVIFIEQQEQQEQQEQRKQQQRQFSA